MTTHDIMWDNFILEDTARDLCAEAHAQQTRWDGEPYCHHPYRVAALARRRKLPIEAVAAAYLHDTLEDTDLTYETILTKCGYRTASLVQVLTRQTDAHHELEPYLYSYITRIKQCPIATELKICDLLDNLSTLPLNHKLYKRYVTALEMLYES